MILFNHVKFKNWIPYYGQQKIQFSNKPKENITVVIADAEAGKTSISRGIMWGMFGEVNEGRKYISDTTRLNYKAADEEDFSYSVELEITANDKIYTIIRTAESEDGKNFTKELVCNIDGINYKADKAQAEINKIFELDVSRFYLFDAEMMRDYEELLSSSSTAISDAIKASVEDILGISSFRRAKESLTNIKSKKDKAYASDEANDKNARDTKTKIVQLQTERDALQDVADKTRKEIRDFNQDLLDAKKIYRGSNQNQNAAAQLEELENTKIPKCTTEIEKLEEQIKIRSTNVYIDLFEPIIKSTKNNINNKIKSINKELNDISDLMVYEKLMDDNEISTESKKVIELLKPKFTQSDSSDVRKKLIKYESKLQSIESIGSSKPVGLELISKLYEDLKKKKEELTFLEAEKNKYEALLPEDTRKMIIDAEEKARMCERNIGRRESDLDPENENSTVYKINKKNEEINQLEKVYENYNVIDAETTLSKIMVDNTLKIQNVINDTIDDTVDSVKKKVQKGANEIYDVLKKYRNIQNPSELRLEINDNYGMHMINKYGKEQDPSTGGTQKVALSLIFALRGILDQEGPVFLDAGLQNLDKGQQKAVLEVAPKYARQLIIYALDSELEIGREVYNFVQGKVGKSYTLIKIDDEVTEIKSV